MGSPYDGFTSLESVGTGQETPPTPTNEGQQVEPIQAAPSAPAETPPQADEFIETFNKRFSTQFKADDDIRGLFEYPKKIQEYEGKLVEFDNLRQSVDKYKKDLDSVRQVEAEKYLSSPLMKKAFVADQLAKKYPNSDINVLTELAMSDMDKMSDLDVLAREVKMKVPNRSVDLIKSAILSEIGIDSSVPPEEWDEVALTKLAIRAGTARENLKNLVGGIELPRIQTKEEIEAKLAEEMSKKEQAIAPLRSEYTKFDKFKVRDDLEYTVDDDFKSTLSDMFDAFILKAGNEPTKENLETLNDLRDAFFFSSHKEKIYEAMYKDAESKIRAELDKKLGNTTPPNTATASDGAGTAAPTNDGMKFLKDLTSQGRAKSI